MSVQTVPAPGSVAAPACSVEYWNAWQNHMAQFDWNKVLDICNYVDNQIIGPAICMSLLPELSSSSSSTPSSSPVSSPTMRPAPTYLPATHTSSSSSSFSSSSSTEEEEVLEVLSCLRSEERPAKVERTRKATSSSMRNFSKSIAPAVESIKEGHAAPSQTRSAKRRRSF
eukprot:TRINITY_DN10473_c0_g1_i1.p1 TRINITY_DN10473_c0_g1~~TRINITY_DN10473_c0_g1_i1.p1  ORF type:complete len:170 (-),score=62.11 TRINITY_DN10473_c0_g1_i1:211-720(-)